MTWWQITLIAVGAAVVWIILSALLYRQFFKRFYDILLSFTAVIVLSPLYILLTVVGAIAMKGNPYFVQERPGRRKKLSRKECDKRGVPYGTYGEEKIIHLIKFRTMTNEKDENGNLLPDGKRLNAYGRLLRASSLDELPSIINIFTGATSIVGPRPLLVKYLPRYSEEQRHRHDVRPGLTGLAQVNGRNAISWEAKFAYDLDYVRHVSLWRDIAIIFKTVGKVFKRSGISQSGQATMEEFLGSGSSPLISVVVPIYNVDEYVEDCISAIVAQTYDNLEIILVDDGSTDRSGQICDDYAAKDKRIRVIHKNNEGLVSARKTGLSAATGKYVGYVDGDDWIEKDFYSDLLAAAEKSGCDIVAAGFTRDFLGKNEIKLNGIAVGEYSGERLDAIRVQCISMGELYCPGIYTYVWNKLFKREMLIKLQDAVPNEITIGEDAAVVFPMLAECKSISVIENHSYHYRQHGKSMIKKTDWTQSNRAGLKALVRFLQADCSDYLPQINDFLLNLFLIHSGGRIGGELVFERDLSDKKVVLYSSGTFGQYIMKNRDMGGIDIVDWVDDDYDECRACGLEVNAPHTIARVDLDCILIASTNNNLSEGIKKRLIESGVADSEVLYYDFSADFKKSAFDRYLKYFEVIAE